MATFDFRICDYGYGARRAPMSEAERVKEKERSDAYISDLMRQLEIAEEELRQLKESREKQQLALKAATLPLKQAQSQTKPSGTDVNQSLKADDDIKLEGVENVQREYKIPLDGVEFAGAEAPEVAMPATDAERECHCLHAGMQMKPANVHADSEAVTEASRSDASEGAEDTRTESLEPEGVGGLLGTGAQRDLVLMTDAERLPPGRDGITTGVADVIVRDGATPSDSTASECRPSLGAAEAEDPGTDDAAAVFVPEQWNEDRHCVSVSHDETESQLAKKNVHETENPDSGGAEGTLLPHEMSGISGDASSVSHCEGSTETPPQRVRSGQLEETAPTANDRSALSMPCVKRLQRKQKVTPARTTSTRRREICCCKSVAPAFDPGGHC